MPSKNSRKLLVEKNLNNFLSEYQPQLIEIKKVILRSVVSFLIGATAGLIYNRKIILGLISLFDVKNVNIVLTSPYQFVNLAFGIAIISGLVATFPVFIYHFLRFIRPALKPHEYILFKKLIPVSIFLFLFGCFFGAKIEQFIVSLYSQTTTDFAVSNFWDIEKFLSQIVFMSFAMGIVFQLPVVLTILIRLKVLTHAAVSRQRRYIYVGLTLFGVILPPTDIISLAMIITPLFLLFEGTLLLNRQ